MSEAYKASHKADKKSAKAKLPRKAKIKTSKAPKIKPKPAAPKTAKERLSRNQQIKTVTLDHDFAGLKKGSRMFVATPKIVDSYIRKIPFGDYRTIPAMRAELARRYKCDASCPVSTSIFVKISAQAALEEMADGKDARDVSPFWRLLTSKDKITKRLDIEPEWVDSQRAKEVSEKEAAT